MAFRGRLLVMGHKSLEIKIYCVLITVVFPRTRTAPGIDLVLKKFIQWEGQGWGSQLAQGGCPVSCGQAGWGLLQGGSG